MKATINKEGLLAIESESGLESYALKRWIDENTDIEISQNKLSINMNKLQIIFEK